MPGAPDPGWVDHGIRDRSLPIGDRDAGRTSPDLDGPGDALPRNAMKSTWVRVRWEADKTTRYDGVAVDVKF
jgi:hypothetical protein